MSLNGTSGGYRVRGVWIVVLIFVGALAMPQIGIADSFDESYLSSGYEIHDVFVSPGSHNFEVDNIGGEAAQIQWKENNNDGTSVWNDVNPPSSDDISRSFSYGYTDFKAVMWDSSWSLISYHQWNVFVAPEEPTNPDPSNNDTGVSINTDLDWSNGGGAEMYNVYFGIDSSPDGGELVSSGQTARYYNLPQLDPDETYYWRIDSIVDSDQGWVIREGDVWEFTTEELTGDLDVYVLHQDEITPARYPICELFDDSWNPIDTDTGNSSGRCRFTDLEPGTYNFEAFMAGEAPFNEREFWGGGQEHVAAGEEEDGQVIRHWPLGQALQLRIEDSSGSVIAQGSDVEAGQPIWIGATVRNPGNQGQDVRVRVVLDQSGHSGYEFDDEVSGLVAAEDDQQLEFIFNNPTDLGVYRRAILVESLIDPPDGPPYWQVTDSWEWGDVFNLVQPVTTGNLNVDVRDQGPPPNLLPYPICSLFNETGGYLNTITGTASGRCSWTDLGAQVYKIEAHKDGLPPFDVNEFWGGTNVEVLAGDTANGEIVRHWPFAHSLQIRIGDSNGQELFAGSEVEAGETIWIGITLHNPGDQGQEARARVRLDQGGSTEFDQAVSGVVPAGQDLPLSMVFVNPTELGVYRRAVLVESSIDQGGGSFEWKPTDSWEWSDTFTLIEPVTTGGLEVTILDQEDNPNPDAVCILYDDSYTLLPSESTTADGSGVCTWSGLDPGGYYIEAHSPSSEPFIWNEFWSGSGLVTVVIGEVTTVPPMAREWPYAIPMEIRLDGPLGQPVTDQMTLDVGTPIWIGVELFNATGYDRECKVCVLFERDMDESLPVCSEPQTIPNGPSNLVELAYTTSEPGAYRTAFKVESLIDGTFGMTDSSGWRDAFSVDGGLSPVADFTWSPTNPATGVAVTFADTSTGDISYWKWDFNSDGDWDSTAQNPTHTFSTAGPHTVTLQVESAHAIDQEPKDVVVQSASGGPYVTGVIREFPGFFLDGVDASNTFEILVDWQGPEGDVELSVNGGAPLVLDGDADGVIHVFNMANDFTASWQANTVSITPVNGSGERGSTHTETIFVFPYPHWLIQALSLGFGDLTITAESGEIVAELDSEFPQPHLSEGCDLECAVNGSCQDCLKIPGWVPYIGGTMDLLETYTTLEGRVSSNGLGDFDVYGQTGFFALGGGSSGGGVLGSIHGSGDFRLYAPRGLELTTGTFSLNLEGAIGKDVGIFDAIPALSWVPSMIKDTIDEHVSLRGEIWPSLELVASFGQEPNGRIEFRDGTGSLGLELKVTLEVDVVTGLSATGWVAGGGSATVGVPEPFIRELHIGFEVGADFEVLLWHPPEPFTYAAGCTWTPQLGTVCEENTGEAAQRKLADLPRGLPLQPTVKNYLDFGEYDRFAATPIARKVSSKVPSDIAETTVIANVSSGARPALVETSAGTLLLWEHQDLVLPPEQATDISWSLFDGSTWSSPALVADDAKAEYGVSAGVSATDDVVVAWTRIKDSNYPSTIETTDDIPEYNQRFDVVSSVFDPGTVTWGPITSVTDDDAFDGSVLVCGSGSGGLLLTWLSNPGGLYTSTGPGQSTLKSSIWSGSSWGPVVTAAGELAGVSRYAAAYHGTYGVAVVERDPTPDIPEDSALHVYTLSGPAWSDRVIFAAGGVDNRMPTVAFDATGEAHIVWVRDGDLVHATLSDPTPEVIRAGTGSVAFYSARLLNNPNGHLTVLWQEVVDNGPANLFAMIFDSDNNRWSADRRLTEDGWMGHGLDAYYGSDGVMRVAYAATEIIRTTRQVEFDNSSWTIDNIPQKGQTDIRSLEHSLIVDLAVVDSDLAVTPPRPNVGDLVQVSVDVHNAGDFATNSFTVDYYLGEPESGGTLVGSQTVSGPFAAGSVAAQQFSFTQPPVAGNLVVVIDALGQVTEFSEVNNRATAYFANVDPVGRILATPTSGMPPLAVSFDGTGSSDLDGDPLGFEWAFADGGEAEQGALVSRIFRTTGRYPVTLSVTDGYGGTDAAEVVITVSPDTDGDGFLDLLDNCPPFANPEQTDTDADGIGDVCEAAGWIFSDSFEGGLPGVWSDVRGLSENTDPVCTSEFHDLDDNQIPAEWDLITNNNAGIADGKLWGYATDGSARLRKDVSTLAGTSSMAFEYDGMLTGSYWGITNGVNIWLLDGSRFTVISLKSTSNYGSDNIVRIHTPDTPGWPEAITHRFPNESGDYHYRLEVTGGQVRFVSTRASDGSVAFDVTEILPTLDLSEITEVDYIVGTTTGSHNWIDNLDFEICTEP